MMTVTLKRDEISYSPAVDMLYIVPDGGSIEVASEIEDLWDKGISVYRSSPNGGIGGIEIYDFKSTYGEPPMVIDVPAREPFKIEIPFAI